MKYTIAFVTFCAFLTSCGLNQDKTEVIQKEVFAIHDEVMPKMGDILSLKEQITVQLTQIDSLLAINPNNEALRTRQTEALKYTEALTKADDGMMDWMHHYNGDSLKTLSPEAALQYLEAEKRKIAEVRTQTLSSIANAQQFLKK